MLQAVLLLSLTPQSPAIAISVSGTATVDTGKSNVPLSAFDNVDAGATIATGENSTVELRLASGSLVRLGARTRFYIKSLEHKEPAAKRRESFKLWAGRVWASVNTLFGAESVFEVDSDNAVAGVRGTSFIVEVSDTTTVTVDEGAVEVRGQGGTLLLDHPGAFVTAAPDGQLGPPGTLSSADLTALQRQTQGPRRALEGLRRDLTRAPPAGAPDRAALREDILGPNRLIDSPFTPLGAGGPPGVEGGPATLRVRLTPQ